MKMLFYFGGMCCLVSWKVKYDQIINLIIMDRFHIYKYLYIYIYYLYRYIDISLWIWNLSIYNKGPFTGKKSCFTAFHSE